MPDRLYYWYKVLNETTNEDYLYMESNLTIAGFMKEQDDDDVVYRCGLIEIGRGTKEWIAEIKTNYK